MRSAVLALSATTALALTACSSGGKAESPSASAGGGAAATSIFDTYKGQLDLEQHGGRTPAGVIVRVLQRILALTTTIWHNDRAGQPVTRSLLAYDH